MPPQQPSIPYSSLGSNVEAKAAVLRESAAGFFTWHCISMFSSTISLGRTIPAVQPPVNSNADSMVKRFPFYGVYRV
jgi:hypothetical protein